MTCRARRESFFWLPVRQFFLFSLFSFSSPFLPSPPTLSSPCLGSSRRSEQFCVSLANRQSPIDSPGYPVFSLHTFSLSNKKKRSERQFNPPEKPSFSALPLGSFFFPIASPRLALPRIFPPNCQRVVRDVPPHFSPTELPHLKTKPQRSPLTRPFFFSRPFLPSSSARLTSHPTGTYSPLPIGSISSPSVGLQCTAHSICECTRRRFFFIALDPGHLGRYSESRCFRC